MPLEFGQRVSAMRLIGEKELHNGRHVAVRTGLGWIAVALGISLFGPTEPVFGRTREASIVESAATVLDEIMAIRLRQIPESLLAGAEGVAIVPDVVKISFVAGLRRGRGVLLVKDEAGAWTPPQFVTLTGGSVGYQAGVQATDVILVFKSRRSIQGVMDGTLTLGADAAVAAGPLGRNAAAATDADLKAEIYTYARSRGLFAGISLDGSALRVDHTANALYYRGAEASFGGSSSNEPAPLPASAVRLMERLARYSGSSQPVNPAPAGAFRQPAVVPRPEELIRHELADQSLELYAILDEGWKAYLALPAEVFEGNHGPSFAALSQSLSRFDTVAADRRYQLLTRRQEFQATHRLLREYVLAQNPKVGARLELPAPPSDSPPDRR